MNVSTTYSAVYYVLESESETINPLAIRPTLKNEGKTIEWEDTSHGFCTEIIENIPVSKENAQQEYPLKIKVKTQNGELNLVYLTDEIFNKYLSEEVVGQPKFKTTEEVQDFYLKRSFPNY